MLLLLLLLNDCHHNHHYRHRHRHHHHHHHHHHNTVNSTQGGGLSRSEGIFLDWRHHLSFRPRVFQSTARRDFRGLMVNKCGKISEDNHHNENMDFLSFNPLSPRSLATYLFLFIAELADLSNSSFTLLQSGSLYQRCVCLYCINTKSWEFDITNVAMTIPIPMYITTIHQVSIGKKTIKKNYENMKGVF